MNGILNSIAAAADKANPMKAGDYERDGVLICGKCNTPKQVIVPWPDGTTHKVGCLCACASAEIEAERQREKAEAEQRRINALRVNGIQDTDLRGCTFDNSKPLPMIEKAKRYVDKWPQMRAENIGLLMWGDTGNGKTYTAACIANALIDKRVPVLVTSFGKILTAVTGMFADERVKYIESLQEFPLLVLDDLGTERQSSFALETVYTVIDNRYKAKLPIIVTTNIPMTELKQAPNMDYQRIYDRILEMCVPLHFTGDSLRKAAAAEKLERARKLFE
jgi:DNA replication protein DnaC